MCEFWCGNKIVFPRPPGMSCCCPAQNPPLFERLHSGFWSQPSTDTALLKASSPQTLASSLPSPCPSTPTAAPFSSPTSPSLLPCDPGHSSLPLPVPPPSPSCFALEHSVPQGLLHSLLLFILYSLLLGSIIHKHANSNVTSTTTMI